MKRLALLLALLAIAPLPLLVLALAGAGQPPEPDPGRTSGVPSDLAPLYQRATERCPSLPWTLLAAQGRVESSFNPRAVSPVGAQGIAQFMPSPWAGWGLDGDGTADPFNPADAIPSQARYDCARLGGVAGLPGDPIALMLAAYNAGPGAVRRYGGIPPYDETRAYVTAVLAAAARLSEVVP